MPHLAHPHERDHALRHDPLHRHLRHRLPRVRVRNAAEGGAERGEIVVRDGRHAAQADFLVPRLGEAVREQPLPERRVADDRQVVLAARVERRLQLRRSPHDEVHHELVRRDGDADAPRLLAGTADLRRVEVRQPERFQLAGPERAGRGAHPHLEGPGVHRRVNEVERAAVDAEALVRRVERLEECRFAPAEQRREELGRCRDPRPGTEVGPEPRPAS
mmetsp:Transcript_5046/g.15944  ORF Transcript_5046/g.15944 Transcript_5046/m.15944 type:complete len:218 (+) Transcript_5046:308-961(+)